jgi:hypothetical protein
MEEELYKLVTQLKQLMDDPHPGLFTWVMAYGQAQINLFEWFEEKLKKNKN